MYSYEYLCEEQYVITILLNFENVKGFIYKASYLSFEKKNNVKVLLKSTDRINFRLIENCAIVDGNGKSRLFSPRSACTHPYVSV